MPRVSVVVATHNRGPILRENLDSVLRQDYADYEAIYVDDRSTDETAAVLEEYCAAHPERLRTLRVECGGPGPARNAGTRIARGELLLFTDDDVTVPASWIREMVSRYDEGDCAGLCGAIGPWAMETAVERYLHYRVQGALRRSAGPISAAPMMNFMVSRAVFDSLGGFSEGPLPAAEDWEFCGRLRAGGGAIMYHPGATVVHRYQRETGPALERMRAAGAAGVQVWLKHHRGAGLYTLYSVLRCAASSFWIPFRYPMELISIALRMEAAFTWARVRAYGRHISGRVVIPGIERIRK